MRKETTGHGETKVCSPEGSVNAAVPLLLLWDIDGTLLSSDGAGRWAMEQAFRELWGVEEALAGIELAGRTDEAILEDAARAAGLRLSDRDREVFRRRYARVLEEELRGGRRKPCALPGVTSVLEALDGDGRFVSGLLTGNWRESGFIKLAAVGLDRWFAFGAFAEDAPTREALLPVALDRASALWGLRLPARRAVVIGDTPRDVSVAKACGARSVAVATGPHGVEALDRCGPRGADVCLPPPPWDA